MVNCLDVRTVNALICLAFTGIRETESLASMDDARKTRNHERLRSVRGDPVLLGTGTRRKVISQ
jgi:hypothetical protein